MFFPLLLFLIINSYIEKLILPIDLCGLTGTDFIIFSTQQRYIKIFTFVVDKIVKSILLRIGIILLYSRQRQHIIIVFILRIDVINQFRCL